LTIKTIVCIIFTAKAVNYIVIYTKIDRNETKQNEITSIAVKMSFEIGKIIQFHRKKSGLSRMKLANFAGVGKTVVFDLEHGKNTIQLDTLQKICNVLNISIKLESKLMHLFNNKK